MRRWRFVLLFLCFCQILVAGQESKGAPLTPVETPSQTLIQETNPPSSEEMTDSYKHAFGKMLFSLVMLISLLVATVWVLKRLNRGKFRFGSSQHISIVEKRALSPKTVLYCIKIKDKEILLAESQLEVRALTTLEERSSEKDEPPST